MCESRMYLKRLNLSEWHIRNFHWLLFHTINFLYYVKISDDSTEQTDIVCYTNTQRDNQ